MGALHPLARRLHREEDGLTAGAEALAFGVPIFVLGTIMIINAWGVVDAKSAANAASREVSRYVTESVGIDPPELVHERARSVAVLTLRGHGFAESRLQQVQVTAPGGQGLVRCALVRSVVTVRVPTVRLPLFGAFGGTYDVRGRSEERIDPLRTGLDGEVRDGCLG